MNLTHLSMKNVGCIEALDFAVPPEAHVIYVKGPSEHGKTTVLQSILALFMGKKEIPDDFLRRGQEKGTIEVTLSDGSLIRWTLTEKGETLAFILPDGRRASSPQARLNEMIGSITLDPWVFCRMKPEDQRRQILRILGLEDELAVLAEKRKDYYDERTLVNRVAGRLRATLDSMDAIPDGLPETEINLGSLHMRLESAVEMRGEHERLQREIEINAQAKGATATEIARLQKQLTELEAIGEKLIEQRDSMADFEDNTDVIRDEISAANETNTQVRAATKYREILAEYEKAQGDSVLLTGKIGNVDGEIQKLTEGYKLPVEGLVITDESLEIDGIPAHRWSTAQGLKIAVSLATMGDPILRIIRITDGSLLDKASKKYLDSLADEKDYQIWIECVSETGSDGLLLEAGEVQS